MNPRPDQTKVDSQDKFLQNSEDKVILQGNETQ
jgi:hypothetical protein